MDVCIDSFYLDSDKNSIFLINVNEVNALLTYLHLLIRFDEMTC
jgi:hypothetical protein